MKYICVSWQLLNMQGTSLQMPSQNPVHGILETVPLWWQIKAWKHQFYQSFQYIQVVPLYLHHGNHEGNNSELLHVHHIQNPENQAVLHWVTYNYVTYRNGKIVIQYQHSDYIHLLLDPVLYLITDLILECLLFVKIKTKAHCLPEQ